MKIIVDSRKETLIFKSLGIDKTLEIKREDDSEPFLVVSWDNPETLRLKIRATSKMKAEGRIIGLPYND